MTSEELLVAMSGRPLCLSCLATVTAPLESSQLLSLFAHGLASRVDTCAGCKRSTRMTYSFQNAPDLAA